MVEASKGYDIPAFANLTTFKTWGEQGPPKGTLYHYPNPHNHQNSIDRGRADPAQDRGADLCAGSDDQDDCAPHAGQVDGEDAGLDRK